MTFIKNKEDFKCENCGFLVVGNGFTNHCPKCLWSKHVDISPGDRKAVCLGMMKPFSIFKKSQETSIVHKCIKCSLEKRNKLSQEDNFEEVIKISSETI